MEAPDYCNLTSRRTLTVAICDDDDDDSGTDRSVGDGDCAGALAI